MSSIFLNILIKPDLSSLYTRMSKDIRKISLRSVAGLFPKRRLSSKQKMVHQSTFLTITARSHRSNNQKAMSETNALCKQVRTYQPTYQLNPRKRFNVEDVEKILKRLVDSELQDVEYSEKVIPELCITLTDNIRMAIKEENYDRYRIIVAVSIGQRRQQSVHMFHSFLWDHERDAFASHNFENCHIYANAVVYGVYLD